MEIEGSIKFADLPEGAQSAVRNVAAYFTMQFDNNDWGPFLEEVTPYSIDADAALVPAALGVLLTFALQLLAVLAHLFHGRLAALHQDLARLAGLFGHQGNGPHTGIHHVHQGLAQIVQHRNAPLPLYFWILTLLYAMQRPLSFNFYERRIKK